VGGGFPFPVLAAGSSSSGLWTSGELQQRSPPPSLPSAISDSFCVRKLLNRHTTSAFGVEEGHIRFHWCAGAAAFSAGLSPALPLERANHLKKQTALHHHHQQHQGATTKHTATPHDPTHSTGRRGLDRPELNCLLRPSGVPACCGVRADIRSDLGWVSLLSRIVLVAARASWLILVRQDRDPRPFPSVLLDCFSRWPESCVV